MCLEFLVAPPPRVTQLHRRSRACGHAEPFAACRGRCVSDAGKPPPFGGRPASLAHHQPSRSVSGCSGLESLRPFRAIAKAAFDFAGHGRIKAVTIPVAKQELKCHYKAIITCLAYVRRWGWLDLKTARKPGQSR